MAKEQAAPNDDLVFAQGEQVLADKDGLPFRTFAGQAWLKTDPLVLRHPSFFGPRPLKEHMGRSLAPTQDELPEYLRNPVPLAPEEPEKVEQATAAPGEVRV